GSNEVCNSDRPQATFHRMSNFSASAVWVSDRSYSSFSTSTLPTRSAGSDGRPVREGNKSAVKLSGNNSLRCSARNANTLPGDQLSVQQLPVHPRSSLHQKIIPHDRTHCRQKRPTGLTGYSETACH